MAGHADRMMFVNATADEVRSLLKDVDCLTHAHVKNLLSWVRGTRGWYPDAAVAVSDARYIADRTRAQGACL